MNLLLTIVKAALIVEACALLLAAPVLFCFGKLCHAIVAALIGFMIFKLVTPKD